MVITDNFVYLHKPKTGGTFVTAALLQLHGGNWSTWNHLRLAVAGRIRFCNAMGNLILTSNKHGSCEQIPGEFLGRTIISSLRHPLDYYVSQYEFGWWKRREWLKYFRQIEGFDRNFPRFPDLSFPDFLRLMTTAFNDERNTEFDDPNAFGPFTVEFIRFYFRRPGAVLTSADYRYFAGGAFKEDMFPVQFLLTHDLNNQLYEFLVKQGYPAESLAFISGMGKVLPAGKGRRDDQRWEKYYTPELRELMFRKDRVLFSLFPEFVVS